MNITKQSDYTGRCFKMNSKVLSSNDSYIVENLGVVTETSH